VSRHPAELIQRKRDGAALSKEEIREFVDGVVDGGFGDGQLGAFLMAVCCRGMSVREIADLTLAMRDSGVVLDLSSIEGVKVDKHSTGGVGDKVSLVLAPLVAAAGVPVPMISGRGLGHTGGTLDKLMAIPGYRTDLSTDEFVRVLRDCGFVMSGPSGDLAPADQRMYALRDVSGTVESVPLITSSILSKKLASGLDGLVMDVKVGRAAFMKNRTDAETLMESLVRVGNEAGKRVRALMTDMDTPLGCAVGNTLEVRETIAALRGEGPADLMEVVFALGGEMLVLAGVADDATAGERELQKTLARGAAMECFLRNVERQGGDPRIVDDNSLMPTAPVVSRLGSSVGGFVVDIDPMVVGRVTVDLGGGRRQHTDRIDLQVGVVLLKKLGDPVAEDEPWVEIHSATAEDANRISRRLVAALTVAKTKKDPRPLILARL
jgi:pyrimidine-nucleoside phosphorylase